MRWDIVCNGLSCPPHPQKYLLVSLFDYDLHLSVLDDVLVVPHVTLADDDLA
jgi:hypothetical protein